MNPTMRTVGYVLLTYGAIGLFLSTGLRVYVIGSSSDTSHIILSFFNPLIFNIPFNYIDNPLGYDLMMYIFPILMILIGFSLSRWKNKK